MTDLFTLAIEQRDKRIAELEAENMEMRLALASGLGYFREHKIARGFHGLGVRKLMRKPLEKAA
jgi:hypothetical protein